LKNETNVEAATYETRRVWATITSDPTWWTNDGALTYIYYWQVREGQSDYTTLSWPGVQMLTDSANGFMYYDVLSWYTSFKLVRVVGGVDQNQTAGDPLGFVQSTFLCTISTPSNVLTQTWTTPTFATTTIVSDFAATIDTSTEACSLVAAQAAVNAYNAMSTFEQDQFDALTVSEGVTGLQRLNYLRTYWNISTTLNVSNVDSVLDDKSIIGIIMVGVIGLTTIGCFYFLTRKRAQD